VPTTRINHSASIRDSSSKLMQEIEKQRTYDGQWKSNMHGEGLKWPDGKQFSRTRGQKDGAWGL